MSKTSALKRRRMGQPFSEEYFPYVKPFRILLVGLCTSGKTSLLYRMKHCKSPAKVPPRTRTFNVSRFERSGLQMDVFDINVGRGAGFVMRKHHYANSKVFVDHNRSLLVGQPTICPRYLYSFQANINAVIFVIDCSAPELLTEALESLTEVMNFDQLANLPIAVFCHKSDLRGKQENALSKEDIGSRLRGADYDLTGVYETSSFEPEGIESALASIIDRMVELQRKGRQLRLQHSTEDVASLRIAEKEAEDAVLEEVKMQCEELEFG